MPDSAPLPALPMPRGVLHASMISASGMMRSSEIRWLAAFAARRRPKSIRAAAGQGKISCNIARRSGSTQFPVEIPHLPHEQVGLLERREMAAFGHLTPVRDVDVACLHPLAHGRDDLLVEHGNAGRHFDGMHR